MASAAIESLQKAKAAAPSSSTTETTAVQLPASSNDGGTVTTGTSDSMATGNFDIAEAVAALNESGDEYTESLIEITRCRSRGSIIPGGNAASGGGRRRSSATSRRTSFGSSIIMHATRRRRSRMSSGRTSSSGESLLTTSRSKSRSSAVSKGDLDTVKLHNEVIEQAK